MIQLHLQKFNFKIHLFNILSIIQFNIKKIEIFYKFSNNLIKLTKLKNLPFNPLGYITWTN